MKRPRSITHEFVDAAPSQREEGKLYISLKYRTAIHSCFCGCGAKIVTPIKPTKWKFLFDGDTISLFPSVGNWSYPCRSHYIIKNGRAMPAGDMTQEEIAHGRERDRAAENAYFGVGAPTRSPERSEDRPPAKKGGFWAWLRGR